MNLVETYVAIRPSIVALGFRTTVGPSDQPPAFPTLLATGFVVDERGLIATNRHVAEEMVRVENAPGVRRPNGFAMFIADGVMGDGGRGLKALFVDILKYWVIAEVSSKGPYYGETIPDLAFLQVAMCQLPCVNFAHDISSVRSGTGIATAGFPLGTNALTAFGKVTQVAPTLRHGIVSSVIPFESSAPDGFTIDALIQGGSSGSPVFATSDPHVIGMVSATLGDTNHTFVIPSSMIIRALGAGILDEFASGLTSVPTFSERISRPPQGLGWVPVKRD